MAIGFEAQAKVGVVESVPIESVKQHPQNPRKHRIEMIAKALQQFGQRSPIVVARDTNFILKGNGTWQAAKMLGWETIQVSWSDLTGDEAIAYMLSDNRPSDLASYDRKKLRDGLAAMIAGPGLNTTLWGADEFEDLDEEFRGVATMPEKAGTKEAEEAPTEPDIPKSQNPTVKMREVPFVFTAQEHAVFMEWLSQLKSAFGTDDWKQTVFEAIKRQAAWESDGINQKGKIAPPVAEGQVGLDESIEAVTAKPKPPHEYRMNRGDKVGEEGSRCLECGEPEGGPNHVPTGKEEAVEPAPTTLGEDDLMGF